MKRFLIFKLVGPLIGTVVMTAWATWGIKGIYTPETMLRALVSMIYTTRIFILIMSLLSWASDLVLIHWQVKLPVRIATIGGVVTVLTAGLERFEQLIVLIGAMCGTIAAFGVWLSARVQQREPVGPPTI